MRDAATSWPTTLQNLKAASRFRPVDMINWSRLVKPLRTQSNEAPDFDLLAMLFHMFTRMPFDYVPHAPSGERPESWIVPPSRRLAGEPSVGLFVDAPEHLSGVATTLNNWNRQAMSHGLSMRVHSAGDRPVIEGAATFGQTGTFRLAAYEGLSLRMTSVSDVLDYVFQSDIDVFHLSTPGPVGLIGLLAARSRKRPVVSTFHTHFPAYVARLTGDPRLEEIAWSFMAWFYGQMDRIAAPSTSVRDELIQHGIRPEKIRVVGRGVDTQTFSPTHRHDAQRTEWNASPETNVLLYVGRLSKEKNLDCLADAFIELCRTRRDAVLVLVGEGPHAEPLRVKLAGLPVIFAGTRRGADLARHYASADVFVFPSETDTLGNVVLEAQASGLPVVVSSQGGPRDCMVDGGTGLIVPDMKPDTLAAALLQVISCPEKRHSMRCAARQLSLRFTHEAAFRAFWDLHRF